MYKDNDCNLSYPLILQTFEKNTQKSLDLKSFDPQYDSA